MGVVKGAYTIHEPAAGTAAVAILVATGSEVQLCVKAAAELGNVKVVSMPCWELFEEQSADYRQSVLGGGLPVISVEAAATTGWTRYSHAQIGMTSFDTCARGKCLSWLYREIFLQRWPSVWRCGQARRRSWWI